MSTDPKQTVLGLLALARTIEYRYCRLIGETVDHLTAPNHKHLDTVVGSHAKSAIADLEDALHETLTGIIGGEVINAESEHDDTDEAAEGTATIPAPLRRPELPEWDAAHSTLWRVCSRLFRLMEPHYTSDDLIYRAFNMALNKNGDDAPPDLEDLRDAYKRFCALPEQEQQRILNGWKPCAELPDTIGTLDMAVRDGEAVRCLVIGKTGCSYQQYEWATSVEPVDLRIQLGASKAEVLAALDQATTFVKKHFEQAIQHEHYDPTKQV